jgi:hypothetical protein
MGGDGALAEETKASMSDAVGLMSSAGVPDGDIGPTSPEGKGKGKGSA